MHPILDIDLEALPLEENKGFFRWMYNRFWLFFVRYVPVQVCRWLFVNTSNHSAALKTHAKTYFALELMYQTRPLDHGHICERLWTWFWEQSLWNARAVRNRLTIVREILKRHMTSTTENVNVLSLASGSARAVIEAMAAVPNAHIRALMTDMSRDALDYSQSLAQSFNVHQQVMWKRILAHKFRCRLDGFEPDIVEVVGLLDYFTLAETEALLREAYEALSFGGLLIAANILPNPEQRFPQEVVEWDMIYKTVPQLLNLARCAGFEQVQVIVEPIGIHGILVCYKKPVSKNMTAVETNVSQVAYL